MLRWKRTVRTTTSERFLAVRDGREVARADLHYLRTGGIDATIVLDKAAGWSEEQIPDLLASLDEELLPTVDAAAGNLKYAVVLGELVSTTQTS